MSAGVSRVVVAAELRPFLEEIDVPSDIRVDILPGDAPLPAGPGYHGLLPLLTRRVGEAELEALPDLRVIANFAVGYDNIDVGAAARRGVGVSNTPDVLTDATAELTWALILAVARRIGEGERLVRSGAWSGWGPTQLLGAGLTGRVLGIAGAGRIGREVGRRASAFGMRVAYWSRSERAAWAREAGAERVETLDELASRADVLSLHMASSAGTRGIIGAAVLDRMKDDAILINTARGDLVDEPALVDRLRAGRLRAGLDVYAAEPDVPAALRSLENVVVLPHLGSATREARRGMWDTAWGNLLRGVRGEPLLDPVTPAGARHG